MQRASAVYAGLSSYQDNLNTQIRQNVDKINKYGNQLLTLNDQIRAIESGGIEHANDLRDARNQILDELAELTAVKKDGGRIPIIANGRFVLPGTEELNEPLRELD